jgi:hypothetical protein
MTRPIGPAVISALEQLELLGEARYSAGRPPKGEHRAAIDTQAVRRAVRSGLVDKQGNRPCYVYRVVPGWRERVNAAPMRVAAANSVWDLAKGTV